jgi:hypothetical protein
LLIFKILSQKVHQMKPKKISPPNKAHSARINQFQFMKERSFSTQTAKATQLDELIERAELIFLAYLIVEI